MAIDPVFERVFRRIYGKPCWGVKNCVGSDITFEFGQPHLRVREPAIASPKASRRVRELLATRGVYVRGQWHLWIWMCSWEILQEDRRVGSDRSKNLDRAVHSLDGQKLVGFSMKRYGKECRFKFDLGGTLVTHSYSEPAADRQADHWKLFEPTGHVLTLRNDGTFSYQRSNQPADARPWKAVNRPAMGRRNQVSA